MDNINIQFSDPLKSKMYEHYFNQLLSNTERLKKQFNRDNLDGIMITDCFEGNYTISCYIINGENDLLPGGQTSINMTIPAEEHEIAKVIIAVIIEEVVSKGISGFNSNPSKEASICSIKNNSDFELTIMQGPNKSASIWDGEFNFTFLNENPLEKTNDDKSL